MRAGKLRHRIRILRRMDNKDAQGGFDPSWSEFIQLPAAIEPAKVIATFGGQQLQQNFDTLIRCRYYPGVRTSMRVEWTPPDSDEPKSYEIVGVRVPDETRHREMYLHCVERQADGFRRG